MQYQHFWLMFFGFCWRTIFQCIAVENSADVIAALWLVNYFDIPMLLEYQYDRFFKICKEENFLSLLNQANCLSCINLIKNDIRKYQKHCCSPDIIKLIVLCMLEEAYHSTENKELMY